MTVIKSEIKDLPPSLPFLNPDIHSFTDSKLENMDNKASQFSTNVYNHIFFKQCTA